MHIYRCDLTLMEALFFSSREVSDLYQTEPVIGNYALAYAMKFCQSAYHNDGSITYAQDLGKLNEAGVYVTPATFSNAPKFLLRRFNAQTDAYWSAYGAGVIAARSPTGWSRKDGQHWYQVEPDGGEKRQNATNRPQTGRIRLLAAENYATFYILSLKEIPIPRYIRLGKFMSKARLEVIPVSFAVSERKSEVVRCLLNPADLAPDSALTTFDMFNVPPMPLIRNARIEGTFYQLRAGATSEVPCLPVGMRFGVEMRP
jgi:CRISPR-associated protein Csc1